jgi:hypothetical protein
MTMGNTEHMVFALDNDDGALHAFPSVIEATAHCKGVDVLDEFWRFFDDDGSPLEARWEGMAAPADDALISEYTLERAMSGRWLQERLPQVTKVSGCGLATLGDLAEVLKINRGKRVERDSARR